MAITDRLPEEEASIVSSPAGILAARPMVMGGAGFSYQLHRNPETLPIRELISRAFQLGITAIDTSPYYEPSEQLMGAAINSPDIKQRWPRESYILMTKVGRIVVDQFDYSPAWVRKSVLRSLERFRTSYLDVVFCHDVEFVSREEAVVAVGTLFDMVDEGKIKQVGISGYNIETLIGVARESRLRYGRSISVVQAWAQLTLSNTKLLTQGLAAFEILGISTICASSPLAIGLLREGGVPTGALGDWHPAPPALRERAADVAQWTRQKGHSLASLAVRYAVDTALQYSTSNLSISTIVGISTMSDLESNVKSAQQVFRRRSYPGLPSHAIINAYIDGGGDERVSVTEDKELYMGVRKRFGEWMNYDLSE
jgi:D-arabinose 1-dehydrogenase